MNYITSEELLPEIKQSLKGLVNKHPGTQEVPQSIMAQTQPLGNVLDKLLEHINRKSADRDRSIATLRRDINLMSDRDTRERFTNRHLSKVNSAGQDVAVYETTLIEPLSVWRYDEQRLEGNLLAHGGQSLKRTCELLREIGETINLPRHFNNRDSSFRVETLSEVVKLCTMSSPEEIDDIISKQNSLFPENDWRD